MVREKKDINYLISQKDKHQLLLVMKFANQQGEQQYEENKKEEKSVVDQWLEKTVMKLNAKCL